MDLLNPIIVGVSVRQADDLIVAINTSKASHNEIKHNASALRPHNGRLPSDVKEAIDVCRTEAVALTSKLLKPNRPVRHVNATTEINTYLKNNKDKGVITLTDNKKGKVNILINTQLLANMRKSDAGLVIDEEGIINQISKDIAQYISESSK
jgi:hypothetical protein